MDGEGLYDVVVGAGDILEPLQVLEVVLQRAFVEVTPWYVAGGEGQGRRWAPVPGGAATNRTGDP